MVIKNKTEAGIEGNALITQQIAALNYARVGKVGMLAGKAFQWIIALGKNVNL